MNDQHAAFNVHIVTFAAMNGKVRRSENFHILLWLLKDLCWVMDFRIMGLIMIVPTIAVAVYITILTRGSVSELLHNLAVVCWICANSVWMIGEFFYDDTTRPIATAFFVTGLLIIAYYYGQLFWKQATGRRPE
jgi:hypothetical protein